MSDLEDLLDYRRRVAQLYHDIRSSTLPPEATWARYRAGRASLLGTHPQSPLGAAARAAFAGPPYYPYNPALRFVLPIDHGVEPTTIVVDLGDDGPTRLRRWGRLRFSIADQAVALSLFWVEGYGGGLFLPFRDATSGHGSYGGGRYLLDTIKHADMGADGGLIVDFNYAYNPSCAYDSRWLCPLAPAENQLPVPITAGEMFAIT